MANISASSCTAIGYHSLVANTQGNSNNAFGYGAMQSNTTGFSNTAIGTYTLSNNISGSDNVALGREAGTNVTAGTHNIYIRNPGVANEADTIRVGDAFHFKAFISGIRGVQTINNNAIPVLIDSVGQLGTQSSSRRYKTEIKPMDEASETILALKPVTFHYKTDMIKRPEFGLIAEDVAEVNPDLVICDNDGEVYTVRYEAVNAMLLNEFLKEHRKVQHLESGLAQQQKQIESLTATLQKVSAQLETKSREPQIAANDQ
jgi:Chaperone of endosialidase